MFDEFCQDFVYFLHLIYIPHTQSTNFMVTFVQNHPSSVFFSFSINHPYNLTLSDRQKEKPWQKRKTSCTNSIFSHKRHYDDQIKNPGH